MTIQGLPRARTSRCAALFAGIAGSFLAFAAGCGGETVSASEFPRRLASVYCANIASCCERFDEPFVAGTCEATVQNQWTMTLAAELMRPNVVFDGAAAQRCIDAYRTALALCTDSAAWRSVPEKCQLFKGTVEPGGACVSPAECRDPGSGIVSCSSGPCDCTTTPCSCVPGTCDILPDFIDARTLAHGTVGEACVSTCYDEGSRCAGALPTSSADKTCWLAEALVCGASGTCEAAPVLGETCPQFLCGPGLVCNESVVCEALRAIDEACEAGWQCLSGTCVNNRCRVWSVANAASCAGS